MRPIVPLLAALPVALLLAGPACPAETWPWGEIPREELFATHFAECPTADAVVLLDHVTVRVDAKNRLRLFRHLRVKAMTDDGLDRASARIAIAEGDEIKNLRAQTIIPPGQIVKVEKQGQREERDESNRLVVVTFPSAQKGAVFEWEYEIRSPRLSPVAPWPVQGRDFVRTARFDLELPAGMSWDATFGWTPGLPVAPKTAQVRDPEDQARELTQSSWEIRNQAPIPALPGIPFPEEYRVTLWTQLTDYVTQYSSLAIRRSWEDIGKDAGAEYAKRIGEAQGVKEWGAAGEGVAAAAGNPEALAKALHRRVRDGLRTDAAARASAARTVQAVVADGHGTPPEKNLVLVALLRAGGIAADPVLVRPRPLGPFQTRWHDVGQLTHVVVRATIGPRTLWLDAADHGAFAVLPRECRVPKGLLAREDGGALVDIVHPDSLPPEASRDVVTTATLDAAGALDATSVVTWTGDRARDVRRTLAEKGDRGFAEAMIRGRFGADAAVHSVEARGAADPEAPLAMTVAYRVPAWARSSGDRMTCAPPFLETTGENPLAGSEGRMIPLELPYRGVSREQLTLRAAGDGWRVSTVPAGANARATDLALKTTYAAKYGALEATREARIRETRIEDEYFEEASTYFDAARAADAPEIRLQHNVMRSAAR
jgi:hypothetical protein